jgi:hypothetical protein
MTQRENPSFTECLPIDISARLLACEGLASAPGQSARDSKEQLKLAQKGMILGSAFVLRPFRVVGTRHECANRLQLDQK